MRSSYLRATVFAVILGCVGGGTTLRLAVASPARPLSAAQALRVCVDRWNQDNMVSWGSMSVSISIRGLAARERSVLSIPNPAQRRCTFSLARRLGDNSWICRIGDTGGYYCPLVTSDGMPALRMANGTTDRRGVLRLDTPLKLTRATPPLAWQRRYPHTDGFIQPWTSSGTLRGGLSLIGSDHGTCSRGSEQTIAKTAIRCFNGRYISDPCFPRSGGWNDRGAVVACASPGATTFARFVISRRS